jgi:glycosyltransferase involved in cell wall biosynthesis
LTVRDELGICENDIVIGHIGGLIPHRDQATLIRAIAIIRRSGPQVKLLLVGDGPERVRLESLARTLDLADNVLFAGYRDAGDLLCAMDLYVNPCLDEGFGIAVIEAMLAGLPVVIARAGSHPELIVDGQSGFLYQAGDPDALAARLLQLIHDPDDARRMGAKARMHAEKHFTPGQFLSRYFAAMQPILNTLTS